MECVSSHRNNQQNFTGSPFIIGISGHDCGGWSCHGIDQKHLFCVKKTSESRRLVLNIKAGAAKRSASAA